MSGTTYARARLWTGISGVGFFVALAATLLALGTPADLLRAAGGTPAADAAALLAVLLVVALLALPFDVAGGLVLPRRHGRPAPSPRTFAAGWLRGVAALLVLSTTSGVLLLAAGRQGGRPASLAVLAVVAGAMLLMQEPLARLVGGLRRARGDALPRELAGLGDVILLEGDDPGFSGGFTGAGTLVLPARWTRSFGPDALAALVERRRRILRSGARRRALVLAVAWNVVGFGLASLLPSAGVTSVAELVTTALGFTLWTFVGLLLLPTPSRRATSAADALLAQDPEARATLAEAVRTLDRLQDDEPERPGGVESVFHPVPSVGNRLRALEGLKQVPTGAWHLARTALFLSHAGLSWLPRAVHCNAGRPELWVYLPSDG